MALPPALLAYLVCPESKERMLYFERGETGDDPRAAFLFCPASRLRYRIEDDLAILIVEEATRVTPAEAARLAARARELGLS
ncbi:MAG TPA: hypothetical protein VHE35_30080 [Kofleriaceae bacterium]|nr:hypothetical protein [Kofleriaceae bacterium]